MRAGSALLATPERVKQSAVPLKKVFKQKKPLKKVSNKREKGPSQAEGTQSLLLSPPGEGTRSPLPSPPSLLVRGPGAPC